MKFTMNLKNIVFGIALLSAHSNVSFAETLRKVSEIMKGVEPQTFEVEDDNGEVLSIEGFRVYNKNPGKPISQGGFVGLNVSLNATQNLNGLLILNKGSRIEDQANTNPT